MSIGPRFRADGCCLLDFYLLWTEQAIAAKDPDRAYQYARTLTHAITGISTAHKVSVVSRWFTVSREALITAAPLLTEARAVGVVVSRLIRHPEEVLTGGVNDHLGPGMSEAQWQAEVYGRTRLAGRLALEALHKLGDPT